MIHEMVADLASIEDGLIRLGNEATVRALQPGLPRQVVLEQLQKGGFSDAPPLEQWWGWHDGTADLEIGGIQIVPSFYPLSLNEAMETSRAFRGLDGWHESWLPLLADGGGYFYFQDQTTGPDGVIRQYRYDESEQPIEYECLASFVASVAEGYRQSAFYNHPDGYLALWAPIYDKIAARLNPTVNWWK